MQVDNKRLLLLAGAAALFTFAWLQASGTVTPIEVNEGAGDGAALVARTTAATAVEGGESFVERAPVELRGASVATISTYWHGLPTPSLFEDVTDAVGPPIDWSQALAKHQIPITGRAFAVLRKGCIGVLLNRVDLPTEGDLRIDFESSPILDVRLINVPQLIREQFDLRLQVEYESRGAESINRASVQMADRPPILMTTDRELVSLSLKSRGFAVVYARSRVSNISYPSPKVAFEPIDQVLEIDLTCLEAACSLTTLSLNLQFPYPHPQGKIGLSIQDKNGMNITSRKLTRSGEVELNVQFRDLPRGVVTPVMVFHGTDPTIRLASIDTSQGGSLAVSRRIAAESSIRVSLSGRSGLADDGVSILIRDESGETVVAGWPRGASHTFHHFPAMVSYVQAIAYDGQRCSSIARVHVREGEAHSIALDLVPGGKVRIAPGAFGAKASYLDVAYSATDVSRVFVGTKVFMGTPRPTTTWLPTGPTTVSWSGNQETRSISSGLNTWVGPKPPR